MVAPYFAFAASTWRLSPDGRRASSAGTLCSSSRTPRSSRRPALGINKVERLAHLYRELDYPDDEPPLSASHHLVDAFRSIP